MTARTEQATPMSHDEYKAEFFRVMIERGHEPQLDEDGKIDQFGSSSEGHNGPRCVRCDWDCCMWCASITSIPMCADEVAKAEAYDAATVAKLHEIFGTAP